MREHVVKEMDKDKDGLISYEEFMGERFIYCLKGTEPIYHSSSSYFSERGKVQCRTNLSGVIKLRPHHGPDGLCGQIVKF